MSISAGSPSNVGIKRAPIEASHKPQAQSQLKKGNGAKVTAGPAVSPTPLPKQISSDIGERVPSRCLEHSPLNVLQCLLPGTSDTPSAPNLTDPQTCEAVVKNLEFHDEVQIDPCIAAASEVADGGDISKSRKSDGQTYTLDHFAALRALEVLINKHATVSHMGILDPSYTFFTNKDRTAALCYKVKNKVAVVGGDPLCPPAQWSALLAEFTQFRKQNGLGVAFLGASSQLVDYAAKHHWTSMRFGTERALNPMTNRLLAGAESKRITKQVKQLVRDGTCVDIYVPCHNQDLDLQSRLMNVYETWRKDRNESGKPQAYMTVFDPFALPNIMIYIYTTSPQGEIEGFAALRRLANGYHIDPYCVLPDAPRGLSEFLIYSAMAILNRAKVSYLGLGFEPSHEMTEISGVSSSMTGIVRAGYRKTFSRLPISGKKAFHDKWHPDKQYDKGAYLVFPDGQPGLRHSLAMMHFNNISASKLLGMEAKELMGRVRQRLGQDSQEDGAAIGQ